ncbi:MAG: aminomethyl-transferring glycine dehydrogenase subunit GcvPB, partial [Alphaproteobacteria bacterium]|nr:aminomethyl-transferring glycine dehydrogenase subunit GcvPB [Alphaproteobacteria bacterium]
MSNPIETSSGHRGLDLAEPLIFELDGPGRCGVDLPEPDAVSNRLGGLERQAAIGLPG